MHLEQKHISLATAPRREIRHMGQDYGSNHWAVYLSRQHQAVPENQYVHWQRHVVPWPKWCRRDDFDENADNIGGQCTLNNLTTHTAGLDFVVKAKYNNYNKIPPPEDVSKRCEDEKCQSHCHTPEFTSPHTGHRLETIISPHVFYAGQQYMTTRVQEHFQRRRNHNGVCHRIDSGCVTSTPPPWLGGN